MPTETGEFGYYSPRIKQRLVANVLFKHDNHALKKGVAVSDREVRHLVRHSALSIKKPPWERL
jgi:ribosomal protein S16